MTPNLKLKLWVHLWGDPLKKVCGIWPRSWFSSKKHDFWFSYTIFRTRFEARGHVPRGCSAHQMKGLGPLMCLATKILKIGPKLRELWPWQSKYPEPCIEVTSHKSLAKIGLKMAELDCFQNCSIWTIKKSQNLKELQGAPLAKSGALNGLRWRS